MAIGLGILGFAHGHVGSYCAKWRDSSDFGVEVRCGWDHDAERLQQAVGRYGFEGMASSAALLAREDISAVLVAAETALHADLVEEAAAAGKTIVVQKPLALTLAQADRMVAAVRRHDVPFSMAWQMRVDPQNLKIRELLASGDFGQVFMVRRRHGLPMCLNPDFATSWHVSPKWNRDLWADDAAHPFDFIYWLLGMPESVTAEVLSLHNPAMPMDNGIALFRYPNGPLAEVSCSFTNRAGENTTEIVCENGSIIQNYGDVPSCNVPRPADAVGLKWFLGGQWHYSDLPTPPGHGDRIANLAGPLAEFVQGRRAPIATVEEGRDVLRLILASYVATRTGSRTAVDNPAINDV